jgi:hypothetical protein
MKSWKVNLIIVSAAALFPLLLIVGAVINYCAVPYWDMWNGTLEFYLKAIAGDIPVWFAQHNEHRIIFARLLFFIDNYFFHGEAIFLIASNIALLVSLFLIFFLLQRKLFANDHRRYILYAFSMAFLFSWLQHENIVWGFQGVFIAAYLFPLAAFYFLARCKLSERAGNLYYWLAMFFSVLSLGTMGNGAATFPIVVIMAILMPLKRYQIFGLVISAVITLGTHFYFYQTPTAHTSLLTGLVNEPIDFALFLLTFLGAPFYYITHSLVVAMLFGLIMIAATLWFIKNYFKEVDGNKKYYVLALIGMLLYVGASALGTSGARVSAGVSAGTAGRYLTPSLVAWVSLATLFMYYSNGGLAKRFGIVVLSLTPLFLVPSQIKAVKSDPQQYYERYVAVLALELNIKDPIYLEKVFPFIDWLMQMSVSIKEHDISIFRNELFVNVEENMLSKRRCLPDKLVPGYLDRIENIGPSEKYDRVYGWMLPLSEGRRVHRLDIVNENNEIIGAALSGSIRPDVKQQFGERGLYSGFTGYIRKTVPYQKLYFVDAKRDSVLQIDQIVK